MAVAVANVVGHPIFPRSAHREQFQSTFATTSGAASRLLRADRAPTTEEAVIDIRTAPYGALVLRLTRGVAFLAHGLLKVIVFTIPGTLEFFQSISDFPPP
jgi:hypothetical protein